ncbi:unnamed protein product [Oikopleura dioica]|uniref:dolichol kinase n=1 Tax=Oikopleura dioica TaxID=34765 RepID=E4YU25_OIKDI|nr:unnamed protein product [Oikopleura dioica]
MTILLNFNNVYLIESFLTSAIIILPLRWSIEAKGDVAAKTFSGVGVIISAGWAALIVTVLIVACATLTKKERNSSPKLTQADCHLATVFYGGVLAFCMFTPLIGIILDYENPVMTVLYSLGRLCDLPHFLMLTIWFGLTILTAKVLENHKKSKSDQFSTAERKIFHGIAVCTIMIGIGCDPELLALVTFAILIIFIWIALYSGYQVYPYGNQIRRLLVTMTDHRDQGKIIATPIYLLFGVSFPIWCDLIKFGRITNSALAGIASIGIGDSFAALVGVKYGKTRIFGEKTLEGCVANYASQLVFYLSVWLLAPESFVFSVDLIISLFLTSLLEAVTDQIDNLVLPVFLYSCLAL